MIFISDSALGFFSASSCGKDNKQADTLFSVLSVWTLYAWITTEEVKSGLISSGRPGTQL